MINEVLEKSAIDKVRQDLRSLQAARGLSNAFISKMSDVPSSTLSQFLSDKYAGDVSKVAIRLRNWLESHKDTMVLKQKAGRGTDFIQTGNAKRIQTIFKVCRATTDMGVIIGPPGMGKTETSKDFVTNNSFAWHVECSPTTASPTQFLKMLAKAMKLRNQSSVEAIKDHITFFINSSVPSTLIVDEAQHLGMKALEEIRNIHDRTGMSIIFMGNEYVASELTTTKNATFAQLSSRIGHRYTIPSKADEADIRMIIEAWGVEGHKESEFLVKIGRSPGAFRQVVKVIKLARLSTPEEAVGEPMFPYLKNAARQLQVAGV